MNYEVPAAETASGVIEGPLDSESIDRAIAAPEASERTGISLDMADVAIYYGLQRFGLLRRTGQALRGYAPERQSSPI